MSSQVQRFVVRAKPRPDHPDFHEWQVGRVCVFVGEDDREAAQAEAERLLLERKLDLMEYEDRSTLIENRVVAEGGAVLEAYRDAQAGRPFVLFAPDDPPIAKKGELPPMLPPRLDESFVDRVVMRAGGRRLRLEERDYDRSRNADYLVNGYVVELKELQSDPIDVPTRQTKAHATLRRRTDHGDTGILDDVDDPEYLAAILKTVKRRIDDAKQQIRSSSATLDFAVRGGGVILLNTGLSSVDPDRIFTFADRIVRESSSLDFVVMMTAMVATNGFDSWIDFPFHPKTGGLGVVEVLGSAYGQEVAALMDEWAANGFAVPDEPARPMHPRVFSVQGARYSLRNTLPPGSMRGDT